MRSNKDVVKLVVTCEYLSTRTTKLSTNKDGPSRTKDTRKGSKEDIKGSNVLVICGKQSASDRCRESGKKRCR